MPRYSRLILSLVVLPLWMATLSGQALAVPSATAQVRARMKVVRPQGVKNPITALTITLPSLLTVAVPGRAGAPASAVILAVTAVSIANGTATFTVQTKAATALVSQIMQAKASASSTSFNGAPGNERAGAVTTTTGESVDGILFTATLDGQEAFVMVTDVSNYGEGGGYVTMVVAYD